MEIAEDMKTFFFNNQVSYTKTEKIAAALHVVYETLSLWWIFSNQCFTLVYAIVK